MWAKAARLFQITPKVTETSLQALGPHDRQCLYPGETEFPAVADSFLEFGSGNLSESQKKSVNVLQTFSSAGCMYECMLQYAFHHCKCAPWNHPMFDVVNQPIAHLTSVPNGNKITQFVDKMEFRTALSSVAMWAGESHQTTLCDAEGYTCFKKYFFKFDQNLNMSCPVCDEFPSCDKIEYERTITKRLIEDQWCGKDGSLFRVGSSNN